MTTTLRDPWADATTVATQKVLDADVAAVRRRLWLRRAVGLVVGAGILLVAVLLIGFLVRSYDDLWLPRVGLTRLGFALAGLGIVLMIVSALRTAGTSRPFVDPADLLPRRDRAWLRTQITEQREVAGERREVVADAARRMVVEGRYTPTYLGLTLMYVGFTVGQPSPAFLVTFSALTLWMLVRIVRGAIWSRRARRWLEQHA